MINPDCFSGPNPFRTTIADTLKKRTAVTPEKIAFWATKAMTILATATTPIPMLPIKETAAKIQPTRMERIESTSPAPASF
jgi:hypothetical protein